jgi:hypothetical protein
MRELLVKASTLRSHLKWITREGLLDKVAARLPPVTAALVRNPPLPSTWMDWSEMEPLLCALDAVDSTAVLRMSRDEVRQDLIAPLRPMVSAVLRLFGTSPATIYGRLNDMVKTTVKGMEFRFTSQSERSGVMDVRYDVEREIPTCMFVSCLAALEMVLELCGVPGTVTPPERMGRAHARFRIRW